ncbi:MAG: ABC transporter ATP-binding protein [Negativicutes bacterium]|nr:ABC transporter ATP-binding protein [Negativicutes bacterium]
MIEVKGLTKQYGSHTAVSDLTFTVDNGQIYGLLGPNGAGKTTTMNIITGCLAATAGQVRIDGHDIFEEPEAAKRLIGYLPEMPPLYQDMTPKEYLEFVARAKGVKKADLPEQLLQVIQITQIAEVQNRLIKHLSKGYKQRVGIAQALLGDPEIIILDEPTVGLDPKQIIEIRSLIKTLGKTHTVILSSHILSEVRAICDSIMILSNGKLVANDTPENLERLFAGSSTMKLTVRSSREEAQQALSAVNGIAQIAYAPGETADLLDITLSYAKTTAPAEEIFFAFCRLQRPILNMTETHVSLEDIFIELTSEKENAPQLAEEVRTEQGEKV